MKNFRFLPIISLTTVLLFTCCQSNHAGNGQANAINTREAGVNTELQSSNDPMSNPYHGFTGDFIKPVGIFASIPENLVQIAETNIMHLYSPDGRFEYMITWAGSDQTPDKMRAALGAGTTLQNGLIHKTNGKVDMLDDKIELTPFGVYDIRMTEAQFEGLEIHDWTSARGILVVTVMSRKEDQGELSNLIKQLHGSIQIPTAEVLHQIRQKISADQKAGIKSKIESKYWNKIVGHTLLNRQYTNTTPATKIEQRFELCESGKAKYYSVHGVQSENLEGMWDIFETEEGIPLLVITDSQGIENKWQIGPHISGNVTIGQVEFMLHPQGTIEGPSWCLQE